jgi:hypothetical protein
MVDASLTGVSRLSRSLGQIELDRVGRTVEAKPGIPYTNVLCRISLR